MTELCWTNRGKHPEEMELLICISQLTFRMAAVFLHTSPKKYTSNQGFPLYDEIKSRCTSLLSQRNTSLRPQTPESPWPHKQHRELQLARDTWLHPVTAALSWAPATKLFKDACRKLPPAKPSLEDGLPSGFLILGDSKVKGQCKLRASNHIAASTGRLRFTWAVPDAGWYHKGCRMQGGGSFSWIFSPFLLQGLEFSLCLQRTLEFLMTQPHPLLLQRDELQWKEQPKVKEINPHLNTFTWSELHYDLCNLLIRFFYW